jgi:type IV pilus assembly protein PilV
MSITGKHTRRYCRLFVGCRQGFSLIEVLVALLILAIGLLGLAGLQARGVATNYSALQRSQATLYAQDIVERMRANRETARLSSWPYQIDFGAAPSVSDPLALQDLTDWVAEVHNLPQGEGAVTMANLGNGRIRATIRIRWSEKGEQQLITFETIL